MTRAPRSAPRRSAPWRIAHDHARLYQDAQAVRRADRQLPGAAAPHGRHDHRRRAGPRMSMFATMAADFDDAKERATAVAAAKVQIGKSGKFVGQQSIQLHGGIGMTHGSQDRPLLQAADHDREHLRRHRLPPAPRHRERRAGLEPDAVIAGLDPAIHAFEKMDAPGVLQAAMPAHDGSLSSFS